MTQTIVKPELQEDTQTAKPARVLLYNCDCHSFEEVEAQLVLATGCTLETAQQHAWTVHHEGRAVVFQETRAACEKVAVVIRSIGLQVEVDWD